MSAFDPLKQMQEEQRRMRQQQEQARQQQKQTRQQQERLRKQTEAGQKQLEQMRQQQQRTLRQGFAAQQQKESQVTEGDAFVHVEKEAAYLRQERAAGRLSEDEFKTRLKELMFQDENGAWWMVGQQSGEWYRNESGRWVRAKPAVGAPTSPVPAFVPTSTSLSTSANTGHRTLGWIVLAVGLVASLLLSSGTFPHTVLAPLINFALGPQEMIWLTRILGAIVTALIAWKVGRG